ncbi:flavoprotein [Rhodopirellula halodulae]|uniref:flavoprotein n=1 Tax=Rhodopirellula halodulae TaxID=2894198 RepID=UPI001E2EAA70|nr:flavoprotein [Rhodopirellula sp. JC737]MCC9657629.1 phosphopantothenoylcysteine decarboxylase [Rhodopirellula sp. JC737]
MAVTTRRILLAIGGGIAAYKAADLCSKMAQAGYQVQVVTTHAATKFIGDATLAALSGRPVVHDGFDSRFPLGSHIELTRGIDAMVVAPATANLLSEFANGAASDLIGTLYLQNTRPVLLAPAMSDPMWNHPAVQRNIATLREDGCHFIGPEDGWLSCRVKGTGRMSEPADILCALESILPSSASESD